MKEFFKTYWSDILSVVVALAILLPCAKYVCDDYNMTKSQVKTLLDCRTYADKDVVSAPNLICNNCGNTLYQAQYNEFANMVDYVCCTCGVYRVTIERNGTIMRPTMLKVFKQNYLKFKENADGHMKYIDSHYIEGHSYRD